MALEINSYALDDAIETFTQEQLAHWYCDVDQPPEPKQQWLDGWLHRRSTHDEFLQYKAAFRRYLRRAVRKLDELWDNYSKRLEADDWDAESDVTQECLDAMEV